MQQASIGSATADLDKFEGFTHAERRPDGLTVLEKTIDFSHPRAPAAYDVVSRGRMRHPAVFIPFLVTDREAYHLHRGV